MDSMKMGLVPKYWNSGLLKMKVVAEVLTGSLFYVEVAEDATVGDLKNEIAQQEGLPGDRLILLLDAGRRYWLDKDEVSLKDFGVVHNSHIYVFTILPDMIASSASPSTPKESTSSEPSHFMASATGPARLDNKDEANNNEAPHQENASDDAKDTSVLVDQEE